MNRKQGAWNPFTLKVVGVATLMLLVGSAVVPAQAATKRTTTKPKTKATTAPTSKPTATTKPVVTATTGSVTVAAPTVRSKKLVIYSGRAERLVKPLLANFTEETGIELEVRYADSSQLAATLLEEGDKTKADVFFSQDAGALGALAKKGRLAQLQPQTLAKVPESYQAANGSWVGVSGRARVFAYDPAQVNGVVNGIDDLINPKFAGKIGFAPTNSSWHSFVTGLRQSRGEDGAKKWLTSFKALNPRSYSGNSPALAAVERGEVAISLVNHYYLYELAGGNLKKVRTRNAFAEAGDPGALINVAGVGVLKEAGNDSAAHDFVKYLFSNDSQNYFARTTYEYPLINTVKAVDELPPLQTFKSPVPDLSDLDTIDASLKLLRETGLL